MYAVEFQTTIENGIVHIPEEYKDLQDKKDVKFVIMYDNSDSSYPINTEKRKNKLNAIAIDTKSFEFNRDEANER